MYQNFKDVYEKLSKEALISILDEKDHAIFRMQETINFQMHQYIGKSEKIVFPLERAEEFVGRKSSGGNFPCVEGVYFK